MSYYLLLQSKEGTPRLRNLKQQTVSPVSEGQGARSGLAGGPRTVSLCSWTLTRAAVPQRLYRARSLCVLLLRLLVRGLFSSGRHPQDEGL